LPDSLKSELPQSLAEGFTLVLPVKLCKLDGQPRIGWWRIDNGSGELIGVMPGGRGQAAVEVTETQAIWAGQATTFMAEGTCLTAWSKSKQEGHDFKNLLGCSLAASLVGAGALIGGGAGLIVGVLAGGAGWAGCGLWC
jgi:hypothetical protein